MKNISKDLLLIMKNFFLSLEEKYLLANKTEVLGSLEMSIIVLASALKKGTVHIDENSMTCLKGVLLRLDSNSRKMLPFSETFWKSVDIILGE